MNYYITRTPSGLISELFRDDYSAIPQNAIPVSDADGELLRHGFSRYQYIDGVISLSQTVLAAEATAAIQAQIDALERTSLMNRFVREMSMLLSIQTAAGMGVDEPTLYAANIGYKKIKDLDTEIAALRAQL